MCAVQPGVVWAALSEAASELVSEVATRHAVWIRACEAEVTVWVKV